jgi:hypothetical protein
MSNIGGFHGLSKAHRFPQFASLKANFQAPVAKRAGLLFKIQKNILKQS